jgi:hypothetical protein
MLPVSIDLAEVIAKLYLSWIDSKNFLEKCHKFLCNTENMSAILKGFRFKVFF